MRENIETHKIVITLISLIYVFQCFKIIFLPDVFKYIIYIATLTLNFIIFYGVKKFDYKIISTVLLLFLFLLYIGIINKNWINYIIIDIVNFSIFSLLLLRREKIEDFIVQLISTLAVLSIIGAACSIIYLNSIGFSAATSLKHRLTFDPNTEVLYLKDALAICRVSVFLLPFIWTTDIARRWLIIASVGVFFVISLMMLSRAGVAATILSMLLTIAVGIKKRKIRFRTLFIFCSLGICLLILTTLISKEFLQLVKLISMRFVGIEFAHGVERVMKDPRDIEAFYFFKSLSIFEWIFGRGLGGANYEPFGKAHERGLAMLHRGENNLILKGGILLLFIVYGLLVFSFVRLIFTNLRYSGALASSVLIYLLLERGHNQLNNMFSTVFVVLAIHYALTTSRKKVSGIHKNV